LECFFRKSRARKSGGKNSFSPHPLFLFAAAKPEAKPRRPVRQNRAEQKNCLYIFCFCARRFLILKGKGNFSARQCRSAARRRAERIGFFQEFLLK